MNARANYGAASRPDFEKHFGHGLDPLEDGHARARPVLLLSVGAAKGALALPRHSSVLNKGLGFDRPSIENA